MWHLQMAQGQTYCSQTLLSPLSMTFHMTVWRTTHPRASLLRNTLPGNCGDKILHPSGTNWTIYACSLEPAGSRHTVCRQIHGKGVTSTQKVTVMVLLMGTGRQEAESGGRTAEGVLTACSHSIGGSFLGSAALPQTHWLDHQAHCMKLRGKATAWGLAANATHCYNLPEAEDGEPLILLSVHFHSSWTVFLSWLLWCLIVLNFCLFYARLTFEMPLPIFPFHFDPVTSFCGCRHFPGSTAVFLFSFYQGP